MKKHFDGSNISGLASGSHSNSSRIWIAFVPFKMDLTFGKILNILEKHNKYIAIAHVQRISFLCMLR